MKFEDLKNSPELLAKITPELLKKAKECQSNEELKALLSQNGIEEEELASIGGGWCPFDCWDCPTDGLPECSTFDDVIEWIFE